VKRQESHYFYIRLRVVFWQYGICLVSARGFWYQCRRDVGEANERAQVWRMKVVDEQRQHKHIAAEVRAVVRSHRWIHSLH
jgi:hypothetical protein